MDQRMEFVMRCLNTDNFRALCAEYGISAKTGYKWRERFIRQGLNGLHEQSRRPHGHARGLGEAVICELARLKQVHPHWGPRKLKELYRRLRGTAPSESTVKRVLLRMGMIEPRRPRQKACAAGRLWSGHRAQGPNEVWTVDFKGWWYDGEGKRCEPLTVRDEYSRYVLELRRMPNARTETVRVCFERLFERYGLPAAIRSDNGAPFAQVKGILGLSKLSAWWVVLGIDLERGRPGHPQDNGAHERLHRDINRELRRGTAGQAELDLWREEFNGERPHEALGMKCPAEIYQKSARAYAGTPEDVSYLEMDQRKVSRDGDISWEGADYFISTSVAGWSVGVKPASEGFVEVWFGRLLLGWIDTQTNSFQRSEDLPLKAVQA